jgi:DNA-binding IclR family transcriptional regulator
MSVQSIDRAFRILEAVADEPSGLSEIARRVGLPKSTVARLLATLDSQRAVERTGDGYRIGPSVMDLAAAVTGTRNLITLARPKLEKLVAATGEAAGMGVPEGSQVRYVVQLDSHNPVNVRDWTGTLAPMHTAASGLTMLAGWSDDELQHYLARNLERKTARTLTEADAIRDRLDTVRSAGYAWGREEFFDGITSLAAPVIDGSGAVVAAIDVFGPSYRFPGADDETRLTVQVQTAAAAVSRSLGQPAGASGDAD